MSGKIDGHRLIYAFEAGCFGKFALVAFIAFPVTILLMLMSGVIEGTTKHPLIGAWIMTLLSVGFGLAFAGLTRRTVIDREANMVIDELAFFGHGWIRKIPLADFQNVTVRHWLNLKGRMRIKTLLAGRNGNIDLAVYYTFKGAQKSGEETAEFCGLPLVYDNRVPKVWPTEW